MHFFIDRNVPVALARMLGHYDRAHTVIYLDDRFDKPHRTRSGFEMWLYGTLFQSLFQGTGESSAIQQSSKSFVDCKSLSFSLQVDGSN